MTKDNEKTELTQDDILHGIYDDLRKIQEKMEENFKESYENIIKMFHTVTDISKKIEFQNKKIQEKLEILMQRISHIQNKDYYEDKNGMGLKQITNLWHEKTD